MAKRESKVEHFFPFAYVFPLFSPLFFLFFIFLRLGYRYIHWSPDSLNHRNYVSKAVERHFE